MIVSISGLAGAGKSVVAEKISRILKRRRYYMGGIRREMAHKKGMTLAEYNKLGEVDPSTDLEVDRYQEALGKSESDFIIEGRTSWHFIPHSLKVFLTVDPRVGAERILKSIQRERLENTNKRNEDDDLNTVEDVMRSNKERVESDKLRYQKYFKIDAYNEANYDFVLDTTELTEQEVYEKVLERIRLEEGK